MKHTITILAILIATLQTQAQRSIKFGASVNYHVPFSTQKTNATPFLFLNAGQSVGLELWFAPMKKSSTRIKFAADYIMGSNNKESITTYAKEKKLEYTNYKFSKAKPGGFSIMASPQFMLFPKSKNKKLPLMWLDLKVGALFSNQQAIEFLNIKDEKVLEIKSNSVNFVYNPSLVVNIIKTKNLFFNLKVGYSNWGGVGIGVGIAESDCRAIHCNRCPAPGCCNPCGSSSFNDSEN